MLFRTSTREYTKNVNSCKNNKNKIVNSCKNNQEEIVNSVLPFLGFAGKLK